MYARVMQLHILPGKLEEFLAAVDSLRPELRKQNGFRAMLILRPPGSPVTDSTNREIGVTTFTFWETMDDLRASEKNMFLYKALARMLSMCRGFPLIHEEEVIASELG